MITIQITIETQGHSLVFALDIKWTSDERANGLALIAAIENQVGNDYEIVGIEHL